MSFGDFFNTVPRVTRSRTYPLTSLNVRLSFIELRAIRDIIAEREHNRIMFVRTDDGAVEGAFATDGYVDARR